MGKPKGMKRNTETKGVWTNKRELKQKVHWRKETGGINKGWKSETCI